MRTFFVILEFHFNSIYEFIHLTIYGTFLCAKIIKLRESLTKIIIFQGADAGVITATDPAAPADSPKIMESMGLASNEKNPRKQLMKIQPFHSRPGGNCNKIIFQLFHRRASITKRNFHSY